jgi:hypothetical protein
MAAALPISIAYRVARVGRVPAVVYTLGIFTITIVWNGSMKGKAPSLTSTTSAVIALKTVQYFLCFSLLV